MATFHTIRTSDFEFHNRIDAELYQPHLKKSYTELLMSGFELRKLSMVCIIRSGTTPPDRIDGLDCGPILFKTTDVRNSILSPNAKYYHISPEIHRRMRKTSIVRQDILLNIVGATLDVIGRSAFVGELPEEGNITQAMVLLRLKNGEILPGFLFAFLGTYFGQDQVKRFARPTGQYNLNLQEVGHIVIPVLPKESQRSIEELIFKASRSLIASENGYRGAKELLESELALHKLTFRRPIGYTAQFSDLELSRRSDAQHYQPQFAALLKHLDGFPTAKLRAIKTLNRRGVQPIYVNEGPIPIVNSQHLGPRHISYDTLERTSKALFYAAPVAHILRDDLLIYTTGAYIGRTNVYLSDSPALASNHVNILRLQPEIDAAYMGLVMQSLIGQLQTQKHARGSAQAELYPSDIDKFVVPLLPPDTQRAIGDLLRESLSKQLESKRLLVEAKTRVEQLIEEAAKS